MVWIWSKKLVLIVFFLILCNCKLNRVYLKSAFQHLANIFLHKISSINKSDLKKMHKEATDLHIMPKRGLYFVRPKVSHGAKLCLSKLRSEMVARNSNSMMQLRRNGQNTSHS